MLFELAPGGGGGGREKGGDSKNGLNSEGNRMLFEIAKVSSSPSLS